MTPHQIYLLVVVVLALIVYSVNLARLDQDKADQKLPIQLFLGSAVLLLVCLFVAPSYVHLVAVASAILMVVAAILMIPHDKGHGAVMIGFAVLFLLPGVSKMIWPRSDRTISHEERRSRSMMAVEPVERDRVRTAIALRVPHARVSPPVERSNAQSMITPFVDEDGIVLSGLRRRHPPRWDVSSQC
jgi:hypothetical protein